MIAPADVKWAQTPQVCQLERRRLASTETLGTRQCNFFQVTTMDPFSITHVNATDDPRTTK